MTENKDCKLNGTNLCKFMGCDGCEKCVFRMGVGKGMDEAAMAERWEVTLSYLPEEIDALHETETCVFCGEAPRECYGELSLGHPEPEYKRGMFFGFGKKVRSDIGSLIDVPISCCKACKRRIIMQDMLQYAIVALSFILGVVFVSIPAIAAAMENAFFLIPLAILVAFVVAGYFISKAVQKTLIKKQTEKMITNPLEIPTVKKMTAAGWFPIPSAKEERPHLHFTKKKVRENFRYFSK
ncbi:MAG: hypothetical protein IKK29_00825 [Christensenellaceae bacterium]|nr:hypothetical protein [Christensenellaceae bacterium]